MEAYEHALFRLKLLIYRYLSLDTYHRNRRYGCLIDYFEYTPMAEAGR